MEAGAVLLFLILLTFAIFWLGVYCYLMYMLGRKLARRHRVRIGAKGAAVIFAAAAALLAAPVLLLEINVIYKTCLFFGIWLINAEPVSVGYWAGVDIGRSEDLQRWNECADHWLTEWEEAAPSCMKQWED